MEIAPVDRFDLRFEPRRWQFADDNRSAIDARFAAKQSANPALWNGRVLLAHRYDVADGICRGAFLETDFASFNAWRDWSRPPAGIVNCFAAAVLRSADGAYLLGVMGDHTANAGQIYFPCGTPEPGDIADGRVNAGEPAEPLRRRIVRHIASQQQPELSDIRIVREPADLDDGMPPFVSAFLRHQWR